jgi:hypothetical protein
MTGRFSGRQDKQSRLSENSNKNFGGSADAACTITLYNKKFLFFFKKNR